MRNKVRDTTINNSNNNNNNSTNNNTNPNINNSTSSNNNNNNLNNNNTSSNNNNTANNNNSISFYKENSQFVSQNNLKRPLTLELNINKAKKQRFNSSLTAPSVLSSPDIQLCKLSSPDLENMIMSNQTLETPTPSLVYQAKEVIVTSEQEDYAKGFVDALNSLRNNDSTTQTSVISAPATTAASIPNLQMSGGSVVYTNLDSFPIAIKDEPQTGPNSPPVSPIDMENQEKIKLERKRQRNRVAASKCRKRKLERISKLEDKVKQLKGENTELSSILKQLKEHVFGLKQQVIDHINNGCNISVYNAQIFKNDIDK